LEINDLSLLDPDDNIIEEPELTETDYFAGCFEYKCEKEKLYVLIGNQKLRCLSGEILKVNGYSGGIVCPENENICNRRFNCKFGCVDHYSNSDPFSEYNLNK